MVARIGIGVFIVLHGLVHLLYFGHSQRYFELQPGMAWPDGSWLLSAAVGDAAVRRIAGAACLLAAAGFVSGGAAIVLGWRWWRGPVVGAAALFTVVLIVLWNGELTHLDNQGLFAILINVALVGVLVGMQWPDLGI